MDLLTQTAKGTEKKAQVFKKGGRAETISLVCTVKMFMS
jgi:hypothetical protein